MIRTGKQEHLWASAWGISRSPTSTVFTTASLNRAEEMPSGVRVQVQQGGGATITTSHRLWNQSKCYCAPGKPQLLTIPAVQLSGKKEKRAFMQWSSNFCQEAVTEGPLSCDSLFSILNIVYSSLTSKTSCSLHPESAKPGQVGTAAQLAGIKQQAQLAGQDTDEA